MFIGEPVPGETIAHARFPQQIGCFGPEKLRLRKTAGNRFWAGMRGGRRRLWLFRLGNDAHSNGDCPYLPDERQKDSVLIELISVRALCALRLCGEQT